MQTKIAPRNRSKKQRTATNIPFLGMFVALSVVVAVGLAGHSDYKYQQLEQASDYCQNMMYNAVPDFEQCIQHQLIVQRSN